MKKSRGKKIKTTGLTSLLFGVLTSALIYIIGVLAFGIAAFMSDDPGGKIKSFSLAALLISGVIGGFVVGKKSDGKYTAALSSLFFAVIMLLFGVILSGGAPGMGNVINCIIYIVLSTAASKLGARKKDGRSHRRRPSKRLS